MTYDDESGSDESEKAYGKKPARASQLNNGYCSPSEILSDLEAHLRHEIDRFNFPEHLEFQPGSHTPTLLHTPSNAAVHSFEKVLLDMRASLGLVEAGPDEVSAVLEQREAKISRSRQVEKPTSNWTKRSLAFHHYIPETHIELSTTEQFTKIDLTPKRHHGYAVLLFIFGTFFPPLAVAARFGIGGDFWLNLLLTILGYFPGHGHNFYIQNIRNNKNHRRTPKWAQKYGLVDDSEIKRKQRRSQWAHRYNERLPQSTLEGQEYEEGQNPTETPRAEENDPFRRPGEGALWGEEDENYYGRRPRANSTQSGSQSSLSNRSTRRWQYPANFNEATEIGGPEDGRKGKKKKSSSKRKDKKDRWGRTADAHAGAGYEDVDGGSKKKKKKKSKTIDDSMFSNRRSESNLSRRLSSTSEFEGPEDAVGGLYGERAALRTAPEPRRDGSDPLAHQF
ncbi:hypothetical protein BN14_02251 [Rhizoctonia solani AG-1 IB]|uniref:Uncharacterized protein n=1 Tax=Thanatephorus cucumeris (strain AG1-IB / isolate 7/3/14) TaxID=1108050 RepID=M5BX19_THACB|nr:hypothetical protein BN14_02251 [Rhizoctonia solani AG-1 IB]